MNYKTWAFIGSALLVITACSQIAAPPPTPSGDVAYINSPSGPAYIWQQPLANAGPNPVELRHGDQVEVLDKMSNEHGTFYRVRRGRDVGYVEAALVSESPPPPSPTVTPTFTAVPSATSTPTSTRTPTPTFPATFTPLPPTPTFTRVIR